MDKRKSRSKMRPWIVQRAATINRMGNSLRIYVPLRPIVVTIIRDSVWIPLKYAYTVKNLNPVIFKHVFIL